MAKLEFTLEDCESLRSTCNNYLEKLENQEELYIKLSETLSESWTGSESRKNVERLYENGKDLKHLVTSLDDVKKVIKAFLDKLEASFSN